MVLKKYHQFSATPLITTFLSLDEEKQNWEQEICKASKFCSELSKEFTKNGYTVQSVRIVTNPFGEYLNTDTIELLAI